MADVAGQGAWGAGHLGPDDIGEILIVRIIVVIMARLAADLLPGLHIIAGGFYDPSVMA